MKGKTKMFVYIILYPPFPFSPTIITLEIVWAETVAQSYSELPCLKWTWILIVLSHPSSFISTYSISNQSAFVHEQTLCILFNYGINMGRLQQDIKERIPFFFFRPMSVLIICMEERSQRSLAPCPFDYLPLAFLLSTCITLWFVLVW